MFSTLGDVYGDALRSGNNQTVIDALRVHLDDVNKLRDTFAEIAFRLCEALPDRTFNGTRERRDMADLCAALRKCCNANTNR